MSTVKFNAGSGWQKPAPHAGAGQSPYEKLAVAIQWDNYIGAAIIRQMTNIKASPHVRRVMTAQRTPKRFGPYEERKL
jgi:hypothetical protein